MYAQKNDVSSDAAYAAQLQAAEAGHNVVTPIAVNAPGHHVAQAQAVPVQQGGVQTVQAVQVMHGGQVVPQGGGRVQVVSTPVGGAGGDEYAMNDVELIMFSYRSSVKCFAMIDIFLSLLSLLATSLWVGILGMIAPVCGYQGAAKLNKCFTVIYLVTLVIKTITYVRRRTRTTALPDAAADVRGQCWVCRA